MSLSFHELPPPSASGKLRERLARLKASMEWAAEAIDPQVRDEVFAAITRGERRLDLGVDRVVVALAGGTGSGKSSLFNALVGRDFAVVGAARPTTSELSAATWADAAPLLDWLGVAQQRRLRADLEGAPAPELGNVVLLDLPDHDSTNLANRAVVDRVLPLADLIVWVVDPQKYADHALHGSYLSVASSHGQPCVVVLNHTDRLQPADAALVADDLARLVREDGVVGAQVLLTSARTGLGVDQLRGMLAAAARRGTVAAEAVRADLVGAGRSLERALARVAEPVLPDADGLVAALARAAGIEALADAAGRASAKHPAAVPDEVTVALAAVEQIRLEWVDAATAGLPLAWRLVMDEAVLPAPALARELNSALAAVDWREALSVSGSALLKGRGATRTVRDHGRAAIAAVAVPRVVAPTEMIHQAYRNLDELTELD